MVKPFQGFRLLRLVYLMLHVKMSAVVAWFQIAVFELLKPANLACKYWDICL